MVNETPTGGTVIYAYIEDRDVLTSPGRRHSTRLHRAPRRVPVAGFLFGFFCLLSLPGCGLTSQQRIIYDSSGIQVGIISDLSTDEHASSPVKNRHPSEVTPREIRSLLGS